MAQNSNLMDMLLSLGGQARGQGFGQQQQPMSPQDTSMPPQGMPPQDASPPILKILEEMMAQQGQTPGQAGQANYDAGGPSGPTRPQIRHGGPTDMGPSGYSDDQQMMNYIGDQMGKGETAEDARDRGADEGNESTPTNKQGRQNSKRPGRNFPGEELNTNKGR